MGETVTNAPLVTEAPQIALKQATGGNCEQYRSLVERYDWNVELALAVMRAESGCNPDGINWQDGHNGCTGSYGLYQVACLHFNENQDKLDVETNIAVAYRIYERSGWQPWAAYTNGSYLKFI